MRPALRRALAAGLAASATTAGVVAATTGGASAATFAGGNVVVYRVGDGITPLSNAAAPVHLDTYAPMGGAPLSTIALPTTTAGAQHALTAVGFSTSEGEITRSPDGRFLTVTGYDAAPGTFGPGGSPASLAVSAPASTGRVVGIVDGNGQAGVDTSTLLKTAAAPKIVRSAVTDDGSRLWVTGGNGGVERTYVGSTAAPTVVAGDSSSNLNRLSIQGGQLFASVSGGSPLVAVGSGTSAASGAALTTLDGLTAPALTYGYTFLDLTADNFAGTGLDTLYLADFADRAGAIEKYTFTNGSWQHDGRVALDGVLGLTAVATNDEVSIAATTPNALYTLTDAAGSSAASLAGPATKLADAPSGTEFRGVALAPRPATGPSVVLRTPTSGQHIAGSAQTLPVAVDVASSDGVKSVSVKVDSGGAVAAKHGTGNRWTASVPVSTLKAGAHMVHVTATDLAATPKTTNVSRPFTIDAIKVPAGDIGPGSWSFLAKGITHTSGFVATTFAGAPGGRGLKTAGTGKVTFTYYGRTLTLHLGGRTNAGKVKVTDNGVTKTFDLYRAKSSTITLTFGPHAFGAHKVTITAPKLKSAKSKGFLVLLGWLGVAK